VSFSVLSSIHSSAFHSSSNMARALRLVSHHQNGIDRISPLPLLGLQGLDPELAVCVCGEVVPCAVYVERESPGAVWEV